MSKPSLVVVGSSNTDMIIKLDRIPKPGETLLGGEFAIAAGGKGANQAVAAARAGGAVTFVARVGRDMFGDRALAGFRADGLNVKHVIRDRTHPSGVALIFVGKDGENSIAVASGANGKLTPADVVKAKSALRGASVLLLQLETPLNTVQAAADLAVAAGARVILNPAPARPLPDKLLRQVYLLTPNESEAGLLTGMTVTSPATAVKAAGKLLARGVRHVIITLGARGALIAGSEGHALIPAFKVKPVDTTAAGDVFNGTLAVALAERRTLAEAARFACAAAAISVTRVGAQTSIPRRREIERLLATPSCSAKTPPTRRRSPIKTARASSR
ncbi:MAG TPA: ribokinase [Verrucomicrobiota bacterium]|nr:ribokinase [Verrucomicrobiota bacterium]HQB16246.1 ribokinase [Verrucomicrobiota bacterium]